MGYMYTYMYYVYIWLFIGYMTYNWNSREVQLLVLSGDNVFAIPGSCPTVHPGASRRCARLGGAYCDLHSLVEVSEP